jgi:transcriptional regulator with XRE-family HTH domain
VAAVGLGVRELAAAAKVSTDTVARLERAEKLGERTLAAIRTALEAAGVEFIDENGGGPGVRLRKAG